VCDLDGVDDFVVLPPITTSATALSAWVLLADEQPGPAPHYLLDARTILRSEPFFGSDGVSTTWTRLVVDGEEVEVAWSSLPIGRWVIVVASLP